MPLGTTRYTSPPLLDDHSLALPPGQGQVVDLCGTMLITGVNASATTLSVASATTFPAAGYAVLRDPDDDSTIAPEIITYTATTASTVTGVTRGISPSTAKTWPPGTLLELVPVAAHHNDLAAANSAVQARLGNPPNTTGALYHLPRTNVLRNSNLRFWQRSDRTSKVVAPGVYNVQTSYVADGWAIIVGGAGTGPTISAATVLPTKRHYKSLQLVGAASSTTLQIFQRVSFYESMLHTNVGGSFTFSTWIFNNTPATTLIPTLTLKTFDFIDVPTTMTTRVTQVLPGCAYNAWTQLVHTFTNPTDLEKGFEVALSFPSGSFDSASKAMYFGGMRLDVGTAPSTEWDEITDWHKCQFYYHDSMGDWSNADSSGASHSILYGGLFIATSVNEAFGDYRFPREMRIDPTVTLYDAAGTAGGVHRISPATANVTPTVVAGSNARQVYSLTKSSAFTAGLAYLANLRANAEV